MSFVRLVIRGSIENIQDWSTHVDFVQIGTDAVTQNALDTWRTAAVAAVTTWWQAGNGPRTIVDATVSITQVTCYYYLTALSKPSLISQATVALPGNSTAANFLDQRTSMVVSLLTGVPGRSNRGRMYLPCNDVALTGAHRFPVGAAGGIAAATATLIDSMNSVALGTDAVGGGPYNSTHPYQTVHIDSLPDTQRRRSNKLSRTVVGTASI